MRKTAVPLIALLLLNLSVGPLLASTRAAAVPRAVPQPQSAVLTNADVLMMLKMGLSSEIIIAKIKVSNCSFDTSPAALQELKNANASDPLILAMMTPPTAAPADGRALSNEVMLTDGTEFEVVTTEEISSKTATEGDAITLKVAEDVKVNGQTVIAGGTLVKGVVSQSKKAGRMGRGGQLGIRIESTTAVDGQPVKLRSSKGKEGDDKTGTTVALVVLFGPLGFLKHGKNAKINPGTRVKVYTDQEKRIQAKS